MMDTGSDKQHEATPILRWWLTERRTELGYSWEDVARLADTVPFKVREWAEGRGAPNPDQLLSLARHLRSFTHPPGAEPLLDASVDVHDFVVAQNGLGIGKCVELNGETATVEYFDTVAERTRRTVPVDELHVVRLSHQTRCYVVDEERERWRMGRIERLADGDRIVAFPGQESEHTDQKNLYVRWAKPVEDPIETLKQKGQETVFFRNRREPFVRALLRQRAASRGASGLLSSSIDLYPHQVEIIRRVLEDPVQRYLLADEVGLGKTVEAGVVIRQFLIDHAGGDVRVFAPSVLCQQWEQELDEKFDVGALGGTIQVDPLEGIERETAQKAPDFLVIDEAHKIAEWAFSDDRADAFVRLASWAHEAERLLVLSATPAHRHEKEFLAMLHLLDPAMYSLDDREAFRERIENRARVGGALRDLREGEEEAFPLRMATDTLRETFPDDDVLQKRADNLAAELEANSTDAAARDAAIRSLRLHVKERYRLHHRMLRSRRSDAQDHLDTHRTAVDRNEWGGDPREEEVHDLLDQWRMGALAASENSNSDASNERQQYVRLFRTLMEAAGSDLELLADVVRMRLGAAKAERLFVDLSEEERQVLSGARRFEGEEALLRDALGATVQSEADADDDFVSTKEEWLEQFIDRRLSADGDDCCVVFVTYPSVAAKLHDRLSHVLGDNAVALHSEMSDPESIAKSVRRFREDSACRVLVCDRSAEEGRNLQFASHLLHYDLPWSPNRIEQRTGRLDRIGRQGRTMHTHVYRGPIVETGSIFEAWYQILDEGFGVFSESCADLQFLIHEMENDLIEQRFETGAERVNEQVERLQEKVEEERIEMERQHQFEELEAFEQAGGSFFERLRDLESESGRLRADMDGWIAEALRFHRHEAPFPDGMLQYQPNFEGKTLVPFDTIMNRFLPRSDKPVTYRRSTAVNSRAETGTAASVFRIGHPFLDELRDYFEWDDRGRAYAIWRQNDAWKALGREDRLYFRFEFVLEADISTDNTDDVGVHAALQRRADATYAPRFETVVTDRDGAVITNERLNELIAAPPRRVQDGGTDMNVKGDRVHLFDRFVDPLDWPDCCQRARNAAEEAVRASDHVVRQRDEALHRAEQDSRDRVQRLRLRANGNVTDRQIDAYEGRIQEERRIAEILCRGIETPSVRLDSVGVVILSGTGIPTGDK